jgi:threonine dehydrogenase-like Zn-dependent dehydrogenase
VQLARLKRCKVIDSRKIQNSLADPQLTKVNELTDDHGVDIVIDTIGDPALMRAALDVLAVRGRLSYIAAPRTGSTDGTFDMKNLYRNEQSIIGCNSLTNTNEEMEDVLRQLT